MILCGAVANCELCFPHRESKKEGNTPLFFLICGFALSRFKVLKRTGEKIFKKSLDFWLRLWYNKDTESEENKMEIKTKIELDLEPQEKDAILLTSALFHQICNAVSDCDNCPLLDLCNTAGTRPHIVLQELVKNT